MDCDVVFETKQLSGMTRQPGDKKRHLRFHHCQSFQNLPKFDNKIIDTWKRKASLIKEKQQTPDNNKNNDNNNNNNDDNHTHRNNNNSENNESTNSSGILSDKSVCQMIDSSTGAHSTVSTKKSFSFAVANINNDNNNMDKNRNKNKNKNKNRNNNENNDRNHQEDFSLPELRPSSCVLTSLRFCFLCQTLFCLGFLSTTL